MIRDFVIPKTKRVRSDKTLKLLHETWYKCLYCQREYKERERAERCVKEHELVLVPIAKNDLGRLTQFLYLKEDKLLTESLVNVIKRYARAIKHGEG